MVQPGVLPGRGVGDVVSFEGKAAGNAVDVGKCGIANKCSHFRVGCGIEECVRAGIAHVRPEQRRRDIALLIEIKDEALFAPLLANPGNQPAEMRLAYPTLEIERSDDRRVAFLGCWHTGSVAEIAGCAMWWEGKWLSEAEK